MKKSAANPQVDAYLRQAGQWREEMTRLRDLLLRCQLTEELKWSKPCYSFQNRNIVIIIPLKESCALMFCQGALLKDARGLLTKPGENTQAGRWLKFTSVREINALKAVVPAYVREAMAAEKAGRKVAYKKIGEYAIPAELQTKLAANPALKTAFNTLTPGRQRFYLLHFSAAKQSATRTARVEKCIPKILQGKGMND